MIFALGDQKLIDKHCNMSNDDIINLQISLQDSFKQKYYLKKFFEVNNDYQYFCYITLNNTEKNGGMGINPH